PTDDAILLDAVLHAEQRRNGLNGVVIRVREAVVERHRGDPGRERGIVLSEHFELDARRRVELLEDGLDQRARRALALDDGHHVHVKNSRTKSLTTFGCSRCRKCPAPAMNSMRCCAPCMNGSARRATSTPMQPSSSPCRYRCGCSGVPPHASSSACSSGTECSAGFSV